MLFQQILDIDKILVSSWHGFFQRWIVSDSFFFGNTCICSPFLRTELGDLLWCTDTGNNVFTLCVDQIFTIEESVFTSRWVTGEAYTCTTVITHVTEYHFHDVDCCSPIIRDVVHLTVEDCTVIVPGTEYGFDCSFQLNIWILRECFIQVFFIELLEADCQFLHVFCIHIDVKLDSPGFLDFIDDLFKSGLIQAHNDIGEHLDESSVGVVSKSCITGLCFNSLNDIIIHTEVEDCVHHTRHGSTCTRTYRYE